MHNAKPQWYQEAACIDTDPDIFFDSQRYGDAKKVCAGCPVREVCLEHAIENEPFGVWGGKTPEGRRRIKKERTQ